MNKKYNDNGNNISKWSTRKLKMEARAYHQQIEVIGCYGSKDTWNYYAILDELDNRGIQYHTEMKF